MSKPSLTGSRIRERRIDMGFKQARLAEMCGISASYLNLIEHNRRRIGGKLLNALAEALEVPPQTLSRGADIQLIEALRDAAGGNQQAAPETDRIEEFAGRFPGWARLVSEQLRRIGALERTIEMLNDRLTHDPFLSASIHDVLSTVTAIRSASGILADDQDVDPEWQARFHRNIYEDSRRLADSAQALVSYLDAGGDTERSVATPQEELETWLEARGFFVPELETPDAGPGTVAEIVAGAETLSSDAARGLAALYLERYREDAAALPMARLAAELDGATVPDPGALAQAFGADLARVLRRIATLPDEVLGEAAGIAVCDASGTLTFRKPVDGFALPRFGAACVLLPLYQALGRPMSPVRADIVQVGRASRRFTAFAVSQPAHPATFDGPAIFEATMLVLPSGPEAAAEGHASAAPPIPIGTSCRICPREDCVARREPSILA